MLYDKKALPPPVDVMRRLLVPVLGQYTTAQLPQRQGLLKRMFFASPAQLIRAPDDAPSTQPGRSTIDAANDVAAEFLRDCESAQNLGDVGDDDLAEMLLARHGNNHKVTGAEVMRNRLPDAHSGTEPWRDVAIRRAEETRIGCASHGMSGMSSNATADERMSDWQVILAEDNSVATEARWDQSHSMEVPNEKLPKRSIPPDDEAE